MIIEGFATSDGTKFVAGKYKNFNFNTLGKTGLLVTEVGFGGYRIDIRSPFNRDALKKALISGINLIDTSANYTDGRSELLIGEVAKELIDSGRLSRESLVIVTKGGYIQGENLELANERKEDGYPFSEVVEYQEGLEHCIHPEFLSDQITQSLDRLELDTIDVYLLHNPEYYLKWAKNNGIELAQARLEYYSRIKRAFEHLEDEVQKGRIKHYGISSNTFPLDSDSYEFTSLEKVIEIAEEIGEDNHFSVVEFPMNLVETGAYTTTNQAENKTLLQVATSKNLGVLINRPLNVICEGDLITLAEPRVHIVVAKDEIIGELKTINNLKASIFKKLDGYKDKEFSVNLEKGITLLDELEKNWDKSESLSKWQLTLKQKFLPKYYYCDALIKKASFKEDEELEMDLYSCTYKLGRLFGLIGSYYKNDHLKLTTKIKENLTESVPDFASIEKLSNMSVRALRSTEGITTVLLGMIQVPYVTDILEELKTPKNQEFNWNTLNFDIKRYISSHKI